MAGPCLILGLCLCLTIHESYAGNQGYVFNTKTGDKYEDYTFAFASYYQNNMVLQSEPESAILWGYGTVGATVNISVDIQQVYTTTVKKGFDERGIWSVKISPHPAGSTADIQGVHDHFGMLQWILLKNILFGDVYVCSGQSNMQFTMSMVFNSTEELKEVSNYPNIRVFTVGEIYSASSFYDLQKIQQSWSVPSPETIGGEDWTYFSAVCWLFGKYLYDKLQKPIGLVASTWGGTPIEVWSPPDVFNKCKEYENVENHNSMRNKPVTAIRAPSGNSVLWNSMIHPLLNMTIKGVLWYQGESNTNFHTNAYQCMFPNMIKSWRKAWYAGTQDSTDRRFPFGFVQIGTSNAITGNYPLIRWHQTADYGYAPNPEMEKTFMAVAMDLPDGKSPYSGVHPRDKQDVAARLVAGALSVIYQQSSVFEGPFPEKITQPDGHKVVIEYSGSQELVVEDNGNFQVCCEGQPCNVTDSADSPNWANTVIRSYGLYSVTIDSSICGDEFQFVSKVRYAWELNPCAFKKCSVYNTLGLPAPPFYLPCEKVK